MNQQLKVEFFLKELAPIGTVVRLLRISRDKRGDDTFYQEELDMMVYEGETGVVIGIENCLLIVKMDYVHDPQDEHGIAISVIEDAWEVLS